MTTMVATKDQSTTDDMAERIRRADVMEVGFEYMRAVGLPFLGWPLPTVPFDPAAWLGHIATAVARAPVCGRSEDQVWADLARIDNQHLQRALRARERQA